jgi:hypothetical protein
MYLFHIMIRMPYIGECHWISVFILGFYGAPLFSGINTRLVFSLSSNRTMTSMVRSLLSLLFPSYEVSKTPCVNCVHRHATCKFAPGRGSACCGCRVRKECCFASPVVVDTPVIDISPSTDALFIDSSRESLRFLTNSFNSSFDISLGLDDYPIGPEVSVSGTINPSLLLSDLLPFGMSLL